MKPATGRRRVPAAARTDFERSHLPAALWLLSAVFIVYGTTIPFNFIGDSRQLADHIARISLNPLISPDTGTRLSIPDAVSNVLLFVPFGCFGFLAAGRKRSAVAKIALMTVLGAGLSAGVETLQLFTADRTSSLGDMLANTAGAFGGAVAAAALATSGRRLVRTAAAAGVADVASFYPLLVAAIVVAAGALEPFDVTLDVGSVVPKIRGLLQDPLQSGPLTDEGLSFLHHLLFTATLYVWLRHIAVRAAGRVALWTGVGAAIAFESAQIFIGARTPGLSDAAVAAAGAATGVPAGAVFLRRPRSPAWCAGIFALTLVGVALQQLSPFGSAIVRPFQWLPFTNYHAFTTSETVNHSAELLLSYFPLGFALAMWIPQRGTAILAALAATMLIAAPVEFLQQSIGVRYPDVTDIAVSLAGGWLGAWAATDGRRLFRWEVATISKRPRAAAGAS
jgi:VanZ family protein